jgi:hypothetical protein
MHTFSTKSVYKGDTNDLEQSHSRWIIIRGRLNNYPSARAKKIYKNLLTPEESYVIINTEIKKEENKND